MFYDESYWDALSGHLTISHGTWWNMAVHNLREKACPVRLVLVWYWVLSDWMGKQIANSFYHGFFRICLATLDLCESGSLQLWNLAVPGLQPWNPGTSSLGCEAGTIFGWNIAFLFPCWFHWPLYIFLCELVQMAFGGFWTRFGFGVLGQRDRFRQKRSGRDLKSPLPR